MSPTVRMSDLGLRRWRSQFVLLVVWGVLYGVAYPHINFWPAAHLALVPLTILALRGVPVVRLVWLTWLIGCIWWLAMTWWLSHITFPGYVAMAIYLGLYPAAYLLIIRVIFLRTPVPMVLGVPVVWVGLEYLRGSVLFNGFPWFSLGHSHPTWLIQIADLFGAYGVSFLPAMTAGLLCDLLTRPMFTPQADRKPRLARSLRIGLLCWAVVLGCSAAYGLFRLSQEVIGPTLRVAVVQTNIPQSNKMAMEVDQQRAIVDDLVRLTDSAVDDQPALIVWPETMVPGSLNQKAQDAGNQAAALLGSSIEWSEPWHHGLSLRVVTMNAITRLREVARQAGAYLIVGAHAHEKWQTERIKGWHQAIFITAEHRYNSAYLVDRGGVIVDRYDKIHRVPFGEYIPGGRGSALSNVISVFVPSEAQPDLRAGSRYQVFAVDDLDTAWRVAAPICFEDVVSHVCRKMAYQNGNKAVDLLVNLTNEGWYHGSAEGPQHEQMARFRCVENRVPMARSVNAGISGFIDSAGRITERVTVNGRTQLVEGVATADVLRDPRKTLFGTIGDGFAAGCAWITMLGIVWAVGRSTFKRTQN